MGVKQVNNMEGLVNSEVLTKARGDMDETRHWGFVRHLKRSQQRQSGKYMQIG